MKTQEIRILDVLIIGPLMMYMADNSTAKQSLRNALMLFGLSTIIYNAVNFFKEVEK